MQVTMEEFMAAQQAEQDKRDRELIKKLPTLHTKVLLKHLRETRADDSKETLCFGTVLSADRQALNAALKAELAKREHVPNKVEAKVLRQQKAHEQRNR